VQLAGYAGRAGGMGDRFRTLLKRALACMRITRIGMLGLLVIALAQSVIVLMHFSSILLAGRVPCEPNVPAIAMKKVGHSFRHTFRCPGSMRLGFVIV
jgi:hypothetical protein